MLVWTIAGLALLAVAVLGWRLAATRTQLRAAHDRANEVQRDLRQQLAESLGLRDALFKAIDDMLIVIDDQQHILYANTAAADLIGQSPIGDTLIATIRQPELEVLIEDAIKLRGESVERRVEYERRIFHARALAFSEQNNSITILTMRDVTELQRLERARREMVSNITHELGTPITNIALLSETVLSLPIKQKHKRVRKLVKDIRREGNALTHLVQEIRDLSVIESGHMPVRLTPTDLRLVVEDSIVQLEALWENKDQTIINDIEPDTLVLADDQKLQRAIKNIVHNAIKFSKEHGKIHISAHREEDEIILAIRDSGPGISPDDLPRIFERFYQVDRARREGTGLGLAIVRHIVLAHGGRTWAESVEGEGATFFIALGSASPAPEKVPAGDSMPQESTNSPATEALTTSDR